MTNFLLLSKILKNVFQNVALYCLLFMHLCILYFDDTIAIICVHFQHVFSYVIT